MRCHLSKMHEHLKMMGIWRKSCERPLQIPDCLKPSFVIAVRCAAVQKHACLYGLHDSVLTSTSSERGRMRCWSPVLFLFRVSRQRLPCSAVDSCETLRFLKQPQIGEKSRHTVYRVISTCVACWRDGTPSARKPTSNVRNNRSWFPLLLLLQG